MAQAALPFNRRNVGPVAGFNTTEAERQGQSHQGQQGQSLVRPAEPISSPPPAQRPCTRASPAHPSTGAPLLPLLLLLVAAASAPAPAVAYAASLPYPHTSPTYAALGDASQAAWW